MYHHAYALEGQLSLFDCLPEDKSESTLYILEGRKELLWYLDAEKTRYFGMSEDTPLIRKILDNPPVYWYNEAHSMTFDKVIWL